VSKDAVCTKDIWLLILKEGGRWGVGEIANEFQVTSSQICNLMSSMSTGGFVKVYPRGEGRKFNEYAVDPTCRIPMAVTMKDIMEAQA
jgi:predicted ArsR family transcriptional regulator